MSTGCSHLVESRIWRTAMTTAFLYGSANRNICIFFVLPNTTVLIFQDQTLALRVRLISVIRNWAFSDVQITIIRLQRKESKHTTYIAGVTLALLFFFFFNEEIDYEHPVILSLSLTFFFLTRCGFFFLSR